MARHLIITADDYGPHWYVNSGILEAVNENLVTTVSVFANKYDGGEELETALDTLVAAIGDKPIGIGCHLTLTSGKPLTGMDKSFLKTDGGFKKIDDYVFSNEKTHVQQVAAEFEAQIGRLATLLQAKGVALDHVSCHHGMAGLFTPYNTALVELMLRNNWKVTARNPLIITKDPRYDTHFKPSFMKWEGIMHGLKMVFNQPEEVRNILKGVMNPVAMKRKGEAFRENNIPCPTYLIDVFYQQPHKQRLDKIVKYFPHNGDYSYGELMVHLGSGDLQKAEKHQLNGIDTDYFTFRRNELKVLREYHQANGFQAAGIELVPMKKVPLFKTLNPDGTDVVYG